MYDKSRVLLSSIHMTDNTAIGKKIIKKEKEEYSSSSGVPGHSLGPRIILKTTSSDHFTKPKSFIARPFL